VKQEKLGKIPSQPNKTFCSLTFFNTHACLRQPSDYKMIELLLDARGLLEVARQRNPNRRLTQPEHVARCIAALCHPATYWLTGNTLHVDVGENIVG
jgi:NAD(P)-dependent dehydrogenase (short-subunit alcohol dehydrogenase family)